MIGGRFSVASLAAAGMLMGGVSAQAADLGGNCCADLEERVAELEATTARKGNRKVSLEVSGHVNEAVLYWDDGRNSDVYQVSNVQSRTRFRFKGKAKINADWSAGFLIEIGMTRSGSSFGYDANGPNGDDFRGFNAANRSALDTRHQALFVKSKSLGTIWLGHTANATEGITQICLGCTMGTYGQAATNDISGNLTFTVGGVDSGVGVRSVIGTSAEGTRESLVKYVSPTFAGFVVSAHWADETVANGDSYGVALRYAGEFGAIRVAGGIGYSVIQDDGADIEELGLSGSVSHTPTGLYIVGSWGYEDGGANFRDDVWHIGAGIGFKGSSLGKTTISGHYANFDTSAIQTGVAGGVDADVFAFAINQKIDAAAMEIYLQYHLVQADAQGIDADDVNLIMGGARIKF